MAEPVIVRDRLWIKGPGRRATRGGQRQESGGGHVSEARAVIASEAQHL
jgi:hypothetical protein